jgi:hypothetical protein
MRALALLPAVLLIHSPYQPARGSPYSCPPSVSELAWLEGVWRGKVVLSASKYSTNGKPAGFEFERFQEKDGHVVLTPYPDGKESPASFRLTDFDQKTHRAVFENPKHDFPTKISYHRVAEDSLTILVSGPGKDGKESVIRYVLRRYGGTAVGR